MQLVYLLTLLHNQLLGLLHKLVDGVIVLAGFLGVGGFPWVFLFDFSDDPGHGIFLGLLYLFLDLRVEGLVLGELADFGDDLFPEVVDGGHEVGVVVELVEHVFQVIDIQPQLV